jgi:hypothetical protein
MSDSLQESVILIRSSNHRAHKTFGTGFSAGCEGQATYIVTCAHVVKDILDEIRDSEDKSAGITADDVNATVVASGSQDSKGIDLAVLCVEKPLGHLPLRCVSKLKGKPFKTAGYQRDDTGNVTARPLDGSFGESIKVGSGKRATFAKAWDLKITSNHHLQEGYSGSPVVNGNGHVVAVVNMREGEGISGTAISVEALKTVWSDMPPHLFWQPRLAAAVNWLNRRLAPIMNRLNIDWGSLAFLILIVAIVMSKIAPTNPDQLTFANNLAITAYYLALVVFCSELCVLAVHILAVHKQWRWLWLVGLVGLVGVGIVVYLPGIIFSLGGLGYDLIATTVPLVFSLVWVFALRKPIASKPEDHLPK